MMVDWWKLVVKTLWFCYSWKKENTTVLKVAELLQLSGCSCSRPLTFVSLTGFGGRQHPGPGVSAASGRCPRVSAAGDPEGAEDQGGGWEDEKGHHQPQECSRRGRPAEGVAPQAGEAPQRAAGGQCPGHGARKGQQHCRLASVFELMLTQRIDHSHWAALWLFPILVLIVILLLSSTVFVVSPGSNIETHHVYTCRQTQNCWLVQGSTLPSPPDSSQRLQPTPVTLSLVASMDGCFGVPCPLACYREKEVKAGGAG